MSDGGRSAVDSLISRFSTGLPAKYGAEIGWVTLEPLPKPALCLD